MAADAVFLGTPRTAVASVSTANTNRDGTGTIATVWSTTGTASRIAEVRIVATGDPADSIVNLFIHDGSTAWLFDSFDIGNPTAASNTVEGYKAGASYTNLFLPNGYSLRASITVALTSGVVNVFAHGGDF